MLATTHIAPFGQASTDLLARADDAARLLSATAAKFQQVGTPLQNEIVRIIGQIEQKFGSLDEAPATDPLMQRAEFLSFASQLRFAGVDGTAGTFPVEFTTADRQTIAGAVTSLTEAIAAVRGDSIESTRKRLVNRNALPQFAAGTDLITEAVRIDNLVTVYEEDVLGRARLKGINPLAIAAGIGIGLLALGGIAYATRRRK